MYTRIFVSITDYAEGTDIRGVVSNVLSSFSTDGCLSFEAGLGGEDNPSAFLRVIRDSDKEHFTDLLLQFAPRYFFFALWGYR